MAPLPFFINDSLIAVDKPGGWLSVPSRMGDRDERPCLGRQLERDLGERLWPIHRLDEEVTGLILFARTAEAHRLVGRWFEERQVAKTYEAWSESGQKGAGGPRASGEQLWESRLLRGKKRAYESPHGKTAVTRALCHGESSLTDGPALRWTLHPVTGRPHQLRFELYRHGYPILGDALYGATRPFLPSTIALRCVRLEFLASAEAHALGLPASLEVPSLAAWRDQVRPEDRP